MKNIQKRFLGLLLACMMICLPAAQAMAAVSHDASAGAVDEILFPGDSLINIGVPVMLDGAEAASETPGTWKNTDENKAFRAQTAEDGSAVVLSLAGYVLTVADGTSAKQDAPDDLSNHYEFPADEKEENAQKDIACYQSGETVKLKAEAQKDGLVFAGWTTEAEGVTFADASCPETTMTMPEKKVKVKATYQEASVKYMLTVTDGVLADGSEINAEGYDAGEQITVNANDRTAEGLVFTGWSVEPADVALTDAAASQTSFAMPQSDVKLTANYQQAEPQTQEVPTVYEVSVTDGVLADGSSKGNFEAGSWIDVAANDRTAEGLTFTGWSTEPAETALGDPTASVTGFTMPEHSVTLTANYEQMQTEPQTQEQTEPQTEPQTQEQSEPQTETQPETGDSSDGSEDITATYEVTVTEGTGSGSYEPGAQVSAAANDRTADGLVFDGWSVDSLNVEIADLTASSISFTMPEGAVALTAHYKTSDQSGDIVIDNGTQDTPSSEAQKYAVTVENGALDGGAANAEFEKDASVKATANDRSVEGLVFTGWTAKDGNGNEITLADADMTSREITFKMPEHVLTLTANYVNVYTVTLEGGVLGDGTSSGTYKKGDTVAVKAPAAEGKKFTGWTGTDANGVEIAFADKTNPETTFLMPEGAVSVKANYTDVYSVAVENGVLGDGSSSGTFAQGDIVNITANAAAAGTKFTGWSGVNTATGEAIAFADAAQTGTTFQMPAGSVKVTASYEAVIQTYRVSVANGTINGAASEMTVDQGTQVTIAANPNPSGQAFTGWKITDAAGNAVDPAALGINPANSTITVNVSQALNFQAQYEGIQYNITVKKGTANYDKAVSSTTVTITANDAPEGKEFDYWEVLSGNVTLKDAYSATTTFDMPAADVTVKAHYTVVEYRLDVENGYGDYEYYKKDDKATVTSDYPSNGKIFDKWVAVSGNVSFADASRWKTTLAMPGSDVSVKATYKNGPSTDNNKILDIVSGGDYYTGDAIKFTASGAGMDNANPNPGDYRYIPSGYQIGNVTGNWKSSPYTTTMAIKAAGEYTLKVNFSKQVYDGEKWAADGTTDTKSVTFRVITKAAGVATGDSTPIIAVAVVAGVSCVIFLILLVVFIRRKRK